VHENAKRGDSRLPSTSARADADAAEEFERATH
jgi:hypothetical protein